MYVAANDGEMESCRGALLPSHKVACETPRAFDHTGLTLSWSEGAGVKRSRFLEPLLAGGASAGSAAAGGAAAGGGAAAARLRLALGQLEECTDWLLAACDADGRRGAVDWAALRSDEGLAKSEWLVVTILYIYSHA